MSKEEDLRETIVPCLLDAAKKLPLSNKYLEALLVDAAAEIIRLRKLEEKQ